MINECVLYPYRFMKRCIIIIVVVVVVVVVVVMLRLCLHRGLFVCLSVSKITQKVMNGS